MCDTQLKWVKSIAKNYILFQFIFKAFVIDPSGISLWPIEAIYIFTLKCVKKAYTRYTNKNATKVIFSFILFYKACVISPEASWLVVD